MRLGVVAASIEVGTSAPKAFAATTAPPKTTATLLGLSLEAAGQPSSHFALAEDLVGKQPPHSWRARNAYPHLTTLHSQRDTAAVTTALERRFRPPGCRNLGVGSLHPGSGTLRWGVFGRVLPSYRLRGTYVHLHLHAVAHPAGAQRASSGDQIGRCTYLRLYILMDREATLGPSRLFGFCDLTVEDQHRTHAQKNRDLPATRLGGNLSERPALELINIPFRAARSTMTSVSPRARKSAITTQRGTRTDKTRPRVI